MDYLAPSAQRVLDALRAIGRPVPWNEIADQPSLRGMHPNTVQTGLSRLRRNNLVHQVPPKFWAAGPQPEPD